MLELYRRDFIGGFYSWRGGVWLLASSLIFSTFAYLLLTDKELSLLDQGESLYLFVQVILALGILMAGASASSAISGEVESGTLESLLLTPIKHRQIALEKLLSVLTTWAILYALSIPYLIVISSGTNLGLSAVSYTGAYGTLLVIAVSSLSISLSARLKSSKNSIMTSLMVVLALLAPDLFFGTTLKKTDFGATLQSANPVSHAFNSLDSVLVDNEQALFLQAIHLIAVAAFLLVCIAVFVYATRRLEIKSVD